eukprot:TRINITY_DN1198_c0_g4_i1.p1 TRINITY_DN1198_c0_g4~~TRINITY_DN1198_c0_g4_i1.p1  ORF type:complete len:285 (-),score=55.59 TRINITY_DN1198_c0_g4_i1:1344-2198(-)
MAPVRTAEISTAQISNSSEISPHARRSLVLRKHLKLQTPLSSHDKGQDPTDLNLNLDLDLCKATPLPQDPRLPQSRRRVLHVRSPRTTSIASFPYPVISAIQSTANSANPIGASAASSSISTIATTTTTTKAPILISAANETSDKPTTTTSTTATTAKAADEPILLRIRSALSKPQLPPQDGDLQGRLTLVLDLDETLLHSAFPEIESAHVPKTSPDLVVPLHLTTTMGGGERQSAVHVWLRQGLNEFLEKVAAFCEVVSSSYFFFFTVIVLYVRQGCLMGGGR